MSMDQMNDVIQRWRHMPGALTQEDHQLFNEIGFAYLAQGDGAQLLKRIQDDKNKVFVSAMGCGLLALFANGIIRKEKSHDHCQAAMTHLTKICSPKELVSGLLEVLEATDPDAIADTVVALAPHLQTALLRMDEDKAASMGLALSALSKQVSRLPVPYTQQQEAADDYGLCHCCTALTTFVKPFVEEVKESNSGVTTAKLKSALLTFCMGMLREPLLQAQLDQGRTSPLRRFATEILVTLSAIQEPHSELLFYTPLKRGTLLDHTQFKESQACLAYLLFVLLITKDSFPAVFSPVFVLQCNMNYVHILLSRKSESFLLKGLALCAKSLEQVQDDSLPVDLMELPSFHSVPQSLQQILTDCPMQHLRERGLQVFQLFINKLNAEAKHKFFRCMLKTSNHAGVEGYITKNIKNQVEFSMKPGNGNGWFLGVEFLPLLELALCLPQGTNTDVLHGMDRLMEDSIDLYDKAHISQVTKPQKKLRDYLELIENHVKIMESLNLLRYLLIRDKEWKSNTNMWAELCRIKDEYLKMLRVCLSISRRYYMSEVKALREDQKLKAKEARAAVRSTKLVKSITVRNEKVSEMSPECQYQVLQSALVTFDLMESLIVRIEEITEEKIKNKNYPGSY